MRPVRRSPRGFTLIEIMVAATVSIIIITMAIGVSVHLQRRGLLEERIMETQNAARATRDMMAFGLQRAGAGVGSASLTAGSLPAGTQEARYAVWPTTQPAFTDDSTFVLPPEDYEGLRSDALEIWETDPTLRVELKDCPGVTPWLTDGTGVCTAKLAPARLLEAGPRTVAVVYSGSPTSRAWACLAQVTAINNTPGEGSVTLTLGLPGRPTPSAGNCSPTPATPWDESEGKMYLLPITTRSYRVSWPDGIPALEVDPDGLAGDAGYNVVSRNVEQFRVRMGVVPPNDPDAGVTFFPETAPARPGLDECTQATCGTFVTWSWDAGSAPPDRGVGSAQDELMRHVRVVEVAITARSQQVGEADISEADGGVDEYGNIQDGFKRRHTVIRLAPRNFGYVETED